MDESAALAAAILARFQAAGAVPVEAELLQPAGTLLDLYGEDIRARAYTTHDPDLGEMMLRPDFTVPVVLHHLAQGTEPARYCYQGEVFRMPPVGSERPRTYRQVGYEVFARDRLAEADAEVFALFSSVLDAYGLTPVTGDIGIVLAAVESLGTTARRRRALRRHIWRPRRFRTLLERFTGRAAPLPTRQALIAAAEDQGIEALIAAAGPAIGLRSPDDVARRVAQLRSDAEIDSISPAEADVLNAILTLRENLPNAHAALSDMAVDLPGLGPAIDQLGRRVEALTGLGIAVENLPFEASYGRTNMEYYDGFVFGFFVPGRPDLPPAATGGRYDALTRILGNGQSIPAVGGVIRPALLVRVGPEASE